MKAIIMAGGEGSRLRPLTCDCPKPMLPLMGRPLMEYAIRLLRRHGIREIGATLGYLPDCIRDAFGNGSALGVHLRYYIENMPLGTAGSVKQAADFLDERFIVLSGDGIADFDLDAALAFHEKCGAKATMILKQCDDPREYGMVVADGDGRIRSFHEKPGRCDVYSDRINTGIYILEPELLARIPAGRSHDFGRDFFPALLADGIDLYGWTADGYWCDVGDVSAYLQVHCDAMEGKIHLPGLENLQAVHAEGAVLEDGCRLDAPCFVAPGARICAGAHIGAGSVVEAGCVVAGNAGVKKSILFPDVQVKSGAQLRGCIAGRGSVIGENARLFEESTVGSQSIVGAGAVLRPGVKLWPEKYLPDGDRPEENIVWGSRREQRFIAGALQIETPAQASRAVSACLAEMKPRELLLGHSGSTVAAAMWHAVAAGTMAQGVQLIDAGTCSLPQLRHSLAMLHADAALLVQDDALVPLLPGGSRIPERMQRSILKLMQRQDFAAPFSGITRAAQSAGRTDISYAAELAAAFRADPGQAPALVICTQNSHLANLAEQAFIRAGLKLRCEWNREKLNLASGEIGIILSDSGEQAWLASQRQTMDDPQRQLACAWLALQEGEKRLFLPNHATRAIDALLREKGAHASYIAGESAAWMQAMAEKAPLQFRLHMDGLYFALCMLSYLAAGNLTLDRWLDGLPRVHRRIRNVSVPPADSARLLYAIARSDTKAELGGGVRLLRGSGWVWLGPDDARNALQIVAEGANMEAADELCIFYESRLKRLLEKRD